MLITPTVITGPSTEPVSLSEVKAQLRITSSSEDTLLRIFIGAAREYLEWRAHITVHQQTLEMVWDYWPINAWQRIELPRATPLVSVTTLSYKESDGTVTTLTASDYVLDTDSRPGGILPAYGTTWPSFTPWPVNAVRCRYVCGIATTSPITECDNSIKMAIALIVGALNENREAEVITNMSVAKAIQFKYGSEAFILRNISKYAF